MKIAIRKLTTEPNKTKETRLIKLYVSLFYI